MNKNNGFSFENTAPAVFVFLWSTGFIGAKMVAPYAEPFTFLSLRFYIVALLLLIFVVAARVPIPKAPGEIAHLCMAGCLVHGVYLGGVFASIYLGVGAGVSALIIGIQPLLTALLAQPMLGERITQRQWWGFSLGFAGVALVVSRHFSWQSADIWNLSLCVIALLGITLGTLYQKRFCTNMDLRSGSMVQFLAAGSLMLLCALLFEDFQIIWHEELIFALVWLIFVLSIGAITLLMWLIRHGAASRVASLFYLVPPVVAVEAWFLFNEKVGVTSILGILVCAFGVWLVLTTRKDIA